MIKAIIFDMDGLMIDSERLHLEAFNIVLSTYGYDLTSEESIKYVGTTDKLVCSDLINKHRLKILWRDFKKEKTDVFQRLITKRVVAQPGLLKILPKLMDFKKAIASNSTRENIETVLKTLKIEKHFDIIASGDDVSRPKPAPDIYKFVAKELSVNGSECVVLEDTPTGIEAAKNAGMFSIAIPSKESRGMDFKDADLILGSLLEVPGTIKKIGKRFKKEEK